MEIVPDLHQLRVPMPDNPLEHLNVYAIRGEDGWAIVDTGLNLDEAYRSLTDQLRELAGDIANLKRIIMTHWHPDHFGLAQRLKADSGAQIFMHGRDVEVVNAILSTAEADQDYFAGWLTANGMPREELADLSFPAGEAFATLRQFQPDQVLHGGEKLSIGRFTFDVIWTPGHSPGHVCLFEPKERILLSGDHILPIITPSISYHPRTKGNPLGTFLSSLRSLSDLDVSLVLPAHEQHFYGLRRRVEELEKHHRDRCDAIMAAIGDSEKNAYDISSVITWAEGLMHWDDMPPFHRVLAVGETVAHLWFMRSQATVDIAPRNAREMWRRPVPNP